VALQHERLLLESRRLLPYTQGAVAGVAQELGVDDPVSFSRFFARHAGFRPGGA
jgi:AraC family transcriptional regulator, transcriptional activator of pobA